MALVDLILQTQLEPLCVEIHGCRVALESIAQSLLRLTEIAPAPPGPDKPMGPETIGSYANALMDLEGEDADELRARLRAAGLTDEQIEGQVIAMFTQGTADEETT